MSSPQPPHIPAAPDAAHGSGHHPHISSVRMYLTVWGSLIVLTILTVAAAQINLGPVNLPLALIIATVKASIVALFFMHLYYDDKFNAVVFGSGLLFLAIFFSLTIIDPLTRGAVDRLEYSDFGARMHRIDPNVVAAPPAAAAAPSSPLGGAQPTTATTSTTSTTSTTGTTATTRAAGGGEP